MSRGRVFLVALAWPIVACSQTANDLNEGLQIVPGTGAERIVSWWGRDGRTFFLQVSDDLDSWMYPQEAITAGEGTVLHHGLSSSGNILFVRLQHTDQPTTDAENDDFDGDRISNLDEVTMTPVQGDPLDAGSEDGDTLPDDWERFHGLSTDVGIDSASVDEEPDGLTNAEEFAHGTDPTEPDSDADGLVDGNDVTGVQDPLFKDHPAVTFTLYFSTGNPDHFPTVP